MHSNVFSKVDERYKRQLLYPPDRHSTFYSLDHSLRECHFVDHRRCHFVDHSLRECHFVDHFFCKLPNYYERSY